MNPVWRNTAAGAIAIVAATASASAENTMQDVSYSLGYRIAQDMQRGGVTLDPDSVAAAFRDVVGNKKPRLSEEQMGKTLAAFQQQMQQKQAAAQGDTSSKNIADGKTFADNFAKQPGVISTPTGLLYKVIADGAGDMPRTGDSVKVHYKGTLIDGREFDSSYKRGQPAEFGVDQVISGWTEALQMMRPGAKWQLVIPPGLAYGPRAMPGSIIGPNSTLVFEVELLEVKKGSR